MDMDVDIDIKTEGNLLIDIYIDMEIDVHRD